MKVLVLSSGGIDSSTCLGLAVKEYGKENVVALSIFYGQKHDKELKASDAVANYYGVEHIKLNLSSIFDYSDCSLLSHSNQELSLIHIQMCIRDSTNMSLFKDGKNAFFDPAGELQLSDKAYSFIAGVLKHVAGITAVDVYKRQQQL